MWQTILSNYISFMVLLLSVVIFSDIALNIKTIIKKDKKDIFIFFAMCTIYTLVYIIFNSTIKTILISLTNTLFYKHRYNISYSKAMLLALLYMLVLIIPDIIVTITITKITNNTYYYQEFAGSIICNIMVVLLFTIIAFILRKQLRKITSIKIENNIKIIIYSILTFICILVFFYKSFIYLVIDINFFVSLFIILTFLIVLGSLIKQTIENNKLTKEYDNLLEFMNTYENEIENQRILRHETKNEFLTIRAKLCDNQKNKEIVNYIDELLKDKIQVKQEEYAKFGYLPANGIKGLCYFKVREAENKGINIALNISKRVKTSPINNLNVKEQKDFGRILGVLLDNAIEASINSKDKKIGIEFYSKSKNDFKMIISNTFENNIDKDRIGKERFSTKGKNRGHGLLLVKQIINNNSMYELKTDIMENLYIQTIIIKKV